MRRASILERTPASAQQHAGELDAELIQQATKVERSSTSRPPETLGLIIPLPPLGRADEVILITLLAGSLLPSQP